MKNSHLKPIDWTKPVRHTLGREILRVLCTDAPGKCPAVILFKDGSVKAYRLDGLSEGANENFQYIENVPPPDQYTWLNVYKKLNGDSNGYWVLSSDCRDAADMHAGEARVARIKVKIEEGRFDE